MVESTIEEAESMPQTDAEKMVKINFAVPERLLKEALDMANSEGWKPAEFHRVVWLMGLNAYAEGSNKRLVNLNLRKNNDKD